MNEPSTLCTTLLIVVTGVWSYLGFQSRAVEEKYIFHPQSILADKEYYRLVTSAFLHADWRHLIFNMISLYLFGRGVEFALGAAQFLLIYFGAVVGGDLLSLYVHRHHEYRSYGASGGVCGIIFAYILLFPGAGVGFFFVPFSIPGWLYAIGFMAYSFYGMKENRGNIGHDAHLGGAIIGLMIAAALHPDSARDNLRVFLIVLSAALLLLVYQWFNPLFLPAISFFGRRPARKARPASRAGYKQQRMEVDVILEKIARNGMESLTPEEKSLLGEVSAKAQRQGESKKPDSGLAI